MGPRGTLRGVSRRWLLAALGAAGALALARLRPFRAAVEGESMAPSLRPGDQVVAVRPRRIGRGDVVVVRPPGRAVEMVKRVVGLPGEEVAVRGGRARVGARALDEPYASGAGEAGAWSLGPDEFLVLGDRRDRSTDGRAFGPVRRSQIVGVVRLRLWPRPGRVR